MTKRTDRLDDLELALSAVHGAGRGIMAAFDRGAAVRQKGPDQPVTAADLEADRLLADVLRGERPDYGWLSEETADSPDRLDRRRVWIVDPIDGTRSFIAGEPEFAISVGLAEEGEAVVGVVYNPAAAAICWAVRGVGAFGWPATGHGAWQGQPAGCMARDGGTARPGEPWLRLAVSSRSIADQAILLASRSELAGGEFDPFHGGWRVQPVGSTAYKLARVAAGDGDVYLSRGPKSEWDVCAGTLLVTEAGGRATDLEGRPLRFNRRDPEVRGILASNGRLHRYTLEVVASLPPVQRRWSGRRASPTEGRKEESK